ncbi:MAG: cardiolipin synthase [Spirochaetae bacterium HGW-Spirochaetae-8]|nr:MAG: cardiolipin synthase [Spirochaetae bacterium HGW-Spirochaetae-8]
MKKILKLLTGRLFTSFILVAFQVAVLVWLMDNLMDVIVYYLPLVSILSFLVVFFVVSRDDQPAFKITWIIVIMAIPVFGIPFYIIFGNKRGGKRVARQVEKYQQHYEIEMRSLLPKPEASVRETLMEYSPCLARQAAYIENLSSAPVWDHTAVEYFALGEQAFQRILEEVGKATRFIFMEYFIIEEGLMWNTMLALLQRKIAEGVHVRLMYDDLGTIQTLPVRYDRHLRELGISVAVFNQVRPHLNPRLNYRDHRKILVIDGEVGFTGGINFADEYINRKIRFGHWKDTTVMIRGDAVWNLSLMFLQQWIFATNEELDLSEFTPRNSYPDDGLVQPFGDSPLDGENVAENAYIQIINNAKRYVWITTPYLIIDTQMSNALCTAAQSGVDVRIITPRMPDKWYVHMVTRSNYKVLLQCGVRIFEYTPGFLHAKMFVSDDEVAIVGTTNMDYRSFYLHFENGVAFYRSSAVADVRNDIRRTLDVSTEITVAQEEGVPLSKRFARALLKLFSPLL